MPRLEDQGLAVSVAECLSLEPFTLAPLLFEQQCYLTRVSVNNSILPLDPCLQRQAVSFKRPVIRYAEFLPSGGLHSC